jgi:hypothetical protein
VKEGKEGGKRRRKRGGREGSKGEAKNPLVPRRGCRDYEKVPQ